MICSASAKPPNQTSGTRSLHLQSESQAASASRIAHDAFWLSQGVEVVRVGDQAHSTRARNFLLLAGDELVLTDPRPALRRIRLLRERSVQLNLTPTDAGAVQEIVEVRDGSRLEGIRRHYHDPEIHSGTVFLTRSLKAADQWRRASTPARARAELRTACGLRGWSILTVTGRYSDLGNSIDDGSFIHALLQSHGMVETLLPTLRECGPGVWVDDRATIGAGARLVGPVWVGPDARINSQEIVIGPAVVGTLPFGESPIRRTALLRRRPVIALSQEKAHGARRRPLKRIFDVIFSTAVLLGLAPVFPLIMLAIWLEDGRPFFFSHVRQTAGGRNFVCYKFRTMCRDAEASQNTLASRNICDGPQFHIEDDPRLLRVGKWLRRLHLDELPQLFNVLLGEMHVIGPRPSPDNENQFCPTWREARLSVKAGITGLWQVRRTRAPDLDYQEWIRFDLEYVEQQSWRLDLKILLETGWKVLRQLHPRRGTLSAPREQARAEVAAQPAPVVAVPVLSELSSNGTAIPAPLPLRIAEVDAASAIESERDQLRTAA